MGTYLNPGNKGFREILQSEYVDKTGLIAQINKTVGTMEKLTCVSRPRRFGKSYAAKMLCAYYDCSCDSHALFDDKEIAGTQGYLKHLNQYHVISLDITGFISEAAGMDVPLLNVPNRIADAVYRELTESYPELEGKSLTDALISCVEKTGKEFVFILDEWDALIREARGDRAVQKKYLNFLRGWFKNNNFTPKVVAAAYMTGILPIKKDGSQSAISDFLEYTMVKPRQYAEYVGFTEEEVRKLCDGHDSNFEMMKQWYDGYSFRNMASVYNPNSVMKAVYNNDFDSYWTQTSAAESLIGYINFDFDGLGKTVSELIGGVETRVDTKGFANDLVTFRDRDDVLTLLIHLGYLAYNETTQRVRIPNEEVRLEFSRAVRQVKRNDTLRRVRESEQLIEDTVHGNEEAVARQIEKIHEEEASLYYNNEQALRSVIKRAYFSYGDEYVMFEELPAGAGCADIVYLPRKDSLMPALVIELKWNQSAESTLQQIRDRRYPEAVRGYGGAVLLVGISYDREAPAGKRKHQCKIERQPGKGMEQKDQ